MKLITLFLAISSYGWAAISANTVWEVRQPSNDTNGGGFVTGASGTDMSLFDNKNAAGCTSCQSDTVNISVTDGVTAGTTTITSATANFSSAIVGNIIYVQGGTGSITAGWYQVTTFTNSTTIVVDRSTGLTTGTGVTINIGGALVSPGQAAVNAIAGNYVFIKYNASPFSITSASAQAAGVITNTAAVTYSGYDSTRTACNSQANRPTLQLNVSTATVLSASSAPLFCSMILDGNSQTASKPGVSVQGYRLHFLNFNTASTGAWLCEYCTFTTSSAAMLATGGTCVNCEFYSNTATPMLGNCISCLSYGNTGASTDGYSLGSGAYVIGSVAYNNGRDGFSASGSGGVVLVNNIAEANGRYGYIFGTAVNRLSINNAAYNNTTAATNGTSQEIGFITITAGSPFTAAGSNNFTINNTASRGALLRNVGFPAAFPVATSTTTFLDVGASRHQDPAASTGGAFGYVK